MDTNLPCTMQNSITVGSAEDSSHPHNCVHGEPYFDDGNIILQAGSTHFKVYRGILSAHSEVFRAMFTIPQPANEIISDGCSIVRLSDSAKDWHHVLHALYLGRNYNTITQPQNFEVFAAFLRIGTKYEIAQLRSEAVKRLSVEYPSSLNEWDEIISGPKGGEFTEVEFANGLDFDVMNLAEEVNVHSLIPAAFYSYASIGFDATDIMTGIIRENDSIAMLSDTLKQACILGYQRLLHKQTEETFKWLDQTEENSLFPSCSSRPRCTASRQRTFYALWHPSPTCMALRYWEESFKGSMCTSCITASEKQHNEGRANIWNELPLILGLSGWDELRKM